MPQAPLPTDFRGHAQYILGGNFLSPGNPFTGGVLDAQRRQAERSFGDQRGILGNRYSGLGQFGGSRGDAAQSQLLFDWSQGLADAQNKTVSGLYESERDRMMQALQGLGAFDTAAADRDSRELIAQRQVAAALQQANAARASAANDAQTRLQIARLQAENALALQGNQLGFDRMQLGLQGIGMMGDQQLQEMQLLAALTGQRSANDQGMLGLAGSMAGLYGDQFLGAAGMVPGLEQAGYFGLGTALGARQGLDQMRSAASGRRYQSEMDQWRYGRYNPQESMSWYAQLIASLGGMGGSIDTEGLAPAIGTTAPNVNPFGAAVQGGLGGWMSGSGLAGFLGGG